jgi:glycosyltransferase involved in cell wall biosynthesis/SAM-dependent methyltransferase
VQTRPLGPGSQIVQQAGPIVFIHAAPRTSSTWFWSKFRALPSTLCYYEPFNDKLIWLTPDRAATLQHDSWESRHTPTDPYYREYIPLIGENNGVHLSDAAMAFQWFIPQGGLRGELRSREKDYLSLLIRHAREAGKIPVFGGWRSLGRVWAIKQAFGGLNIFQYRNLWQQWLSMLSYKRRGSLTFYISVIDTIFRDDEPYFSYLVDRGLKNAADPRTGKDPTASPLTWTRSYPNVARDEAKVRQLELLPEHRVFALFMGLHVYLYLHAQISADLTADVTSIARDDAYRSHIERTVRQETGLAVSFTGADDVEPQYEVQFDHTSVDWGEIREFAGVAVEMLSKFDDPRKLKASADALIDETMEEMRKGDAPAAPPSFAAVPAERPATGAKTIGLCMIVKNEAHVILKCLESARPLVDYVLVVDTGSTDGTQQIVWDYLVHEKLPGGVVEEPWQNFAYNRTFALQKLRKTPHVDYALIIDADDQLELDDGFDPKTFKAGLDQDLYDVEVAHGDMIHIRPQLFRNDLPFSFKGVVHEYLEAPPGDLSRGRAAGFRVKISGGGARSRNTRKFEDDAALLERTLATETDPFLISRYTFYLAQSYRDCGQKEKALENYWKRAELGYWAEEIYISLLEAGNMMAALGHPFDEVIATYLRASDLVPTRAEALHGASRYCRDHGRNVEGYEYARRGIDLQQPAGALFAQPWIYDYGLLDEFAVNAYWAGAYRESLDASLRLLASDKLPQSMHARVVANARFALDKLPKPSDLGSRGADNFIEQHALLPSRSLRARVTGAPRVLVAILAKQKEAALPLYLDCIEALDYPKSSIVLYIRTNNNTDRTEQILRDWVARVGHLYAAVEFDASDVVDRVEQFREHEWNATRFRVLGDIRNKSLQRARELECEFYFVADVDNFLRRSTLRELVALNLPIVAPLLRPIIPEKLYSNYHAAIDGAGYYKHCDQYYWILSRQVRGVVEVPVIHCTYLVRADVIPELTYQDDTNRYEYVIFSDSARKASIPQYIDNRQLYGYITFAEGELYLADGIEHARTLLRDDLEEAAACAHIAVVLPPGEHAGAYADVAHTVFHGLRQIGFDANLVASPLEVSGRAIVVGGFSLSEADAAELPADTIIYNTEHFSFVSARRQYMDLLRKFEVWDYSRDNAARMPALLGKEVRYVRLGFVPELMRVSKLETEDIDVLFYGSFNERRGAILQELRAKGLNVNHVFGVYGEARDALIARSKVVLSMHYYLPGAFEAVRVYYLLANKKAVVAECNPGEYVDPLVSQGFAALPYDRLVQGCEELVANSRARQELEERGFEIFSALDEGWILKQALAGNFTETDTSVIAAPGGIPRRLNLGSGKSWLPEYLNFDRDPAWHPDVVADICDPELFERDLSSTRFGTLRIQPDYFDEIVALDVLEHVPDLVKAMTNCLALLREGGVMRIHVPYDLSFGAWQDPTHLRALNERSWWYYCQWFWYLGWSEARFDLMRLDYGFSPLGSSLKAQGVPIDEITRTPRAVDEMRVLLRKRPLTAEEKAEGERWRGSGRAA